MNLKGIFQTSMALVGTLGFLFAEMPLSQIKSQNSQKVWNFDADKENEAPAGFEAYSGKWIVKSDPSAPSKPNILAQLATQETWPGIVVKDLNYKNVSLEVKFKAISGDEDQAAGIIFRYKDSGNFYLFRANADEDNVELFKFQNGSRSGIKGAKVKVPHDTWCSIKIIAVNNSISCFSNDQKLITVHNDLYQEGKIGLRSKADSVAYFDDLTAEGL